MQNRQVRQEPRNDHSWSGSNELYGSVQSPEGFDGEKILQVPAQLLS